MYTIIIDLIERAREDGRDREWGGKGIGGWKDKRWQKVITYCLNATWCCAETLEQQPTNNPQALLRAANHSPATYESCIGWKQTNNTKIINIQT